MKQLEIVKQLPKNTRNTPRSTKTLQIATKKHYGPSQKCRSTLEHTKKSLKPPNNIREHQNALRNSQIRPNKQERPLRTPQKIFINISMKGKILEKYLATLTNIKKHQKTTRESSRMVQNHQ